MPDEPTEFRPRCMYLHCKSMMVYGEDFEQDPEYQAGGVDFWCVLTSKGTGPDGGDVGLSACSNPTRDCYKEF